MNVAAVYDRRIFADEVGPRAQRDILSESEARLARNAGAARHSATVIDRRYIKMPLRYSNTIATLPLCPLSATS